MRTYRSTPSMARGTVMVAHSSARHLTASVVAGALVITLVTVAPAAAGPRQAATAAARAVAELTALAEERVAADLIPAVPAPLTAPTSLEPADASGPAAAFVPRPARWPGPMAALGQSRPGNTVQAGGLQQGFALRATRAEAVADKAGTVGQLRAQVFERERAERAGVQGVLLRVTNPTADAAKVDVAVDYAGIAGLYGADWASRLRLVSLPDCVLSFPGVAGCRRQVPIASLNDVEAGTVNATLDATQLGILALTAGAEGPTGDWSATPLSPSATWQVSAQTGAFSWSYPMRVPPGTGGPEPSLALSYSAASIDGRVVTTNDQTSWIGEGWGLETGYIERKYVSCSDDMTGGNNATHETWDLCWRTDNATLVFNGQALELVKDAATGAWRAKDDDGTRIERLTGASNGDEDGEYWRVTTTDGTQYFFGRGRRPADDLALNSAWTVPVFGNHSGEPGHGASFATSWDVQAWRWNLDYVVDTSGNSLTYVYATETNNYGRNLGDAVSSYVRGGCPSRIEYGQREGSESTGTAPFKVVFDVAERCLPDGSACAESALTSTTQDSWPDVPFDLICTTSPCTGQNSPTFFTRKRLTSITTQVLTGPETYQAVDRWDLTHDFPDPTDEHEGPSLTLETITHTGLVDGTTTLPEVDFDYMAMPNRVDATGDLGTPMYRYRLIGVTSETGAMISVNYTPQDCSPGNLPSSPTSNTRRCIPVVWEPSTYIDPITEYFHKYLVDAVVALPGGDGIGVETHYSYVGTPAWVYDDSPLTPAEYRTWGDFRGYATVDVVTGASSTADRPRVRYRYLRGLPGDFAAAQGTGTTNDERLNGFLLGETTYDGDDPVVTTTNRPWVSAPTATGADGTRATFLGTSVVEQDTTLAAGGVRTTRTETTYDATYGTPVTVDDLGDISTSADDRCTRLEYVRNTAANITEAVARSETVGVACGATPSRPADVLSDIRTFFDGGGFMSVPTVGLPTTAQRVASYSGGTPVYVDEARSTYDSHGRVLTVTDALDRTTATSYTPATGGPVTGTTTTSPDPDGAGPLTAHVTTTTVNPAWGAPTRVVDANGKVSTASYDPLGRLTAVWLPGRVQGTDTANTTYAYDISSTGVNAVTTSTLTASESYLSSVALYDGLLRERQTQSPSLARGTPGRLVTDKIYDSRGLVVTANAAWATTGTPGTELVVPTTAVPARTRYVYDGAGRVTAEIFDVNQAERWRTTTTYGGDRVSVDPPAGAVPTTTITDARGQTVELRQYLGGEPSGAFQSTSYAYDRAGRLAGMTDAAGNAWSYTYDLRGRQVSATDPDRGTTSTSYDDAGEVTSVTDARGHTLVNVYDGLGRRVELRSGAAAGTLRASWVFDTVAKGLVSSATRYDGGSEYVTAVTGYDDGYRPLGQSVTIPAAEGALAGTYTTSYSYLANGQPESMTLPAAGGLGAETVTTNYDGLSLPEWMGGGLGWGVYVANTLYSAYGDPVQSEYGNSYSVFVDNFFETGTRRLTGSSVLVEGDEHPVTDVTYTYDDAGNPVSIVDDPVSGPKDAQCFAYDGLRRLTAAWTPAGGDCSAAPSVAGLGGAAPYWFTDTFDVVGNRTSRVVHAAGGDTTTTFAYAPGTHRVAGAASSGPGGATSSSFGYDDAGNTTTRDIGDDPTQSLVWDAEGELAQVSDGASSDTYTYTADGDRLVRRQGGSTTVYLPGGMELTLAGATVTATRYYSFNGQVVAVRTGPGTAGVSTLVADHHGTAGLSIANTTRVVSRRYTDPYGAPRGTAPASWVGDHGFLDKPVDASGLVQVGARYYDPGLGRFVSVDPVMDLADPQQWHGYAYANNNPITWSDPTGLYVNPWDTAGYKPVVGAQQLWHTPGYTPVVSGVARPSGQGHRRGGLNQSLLREFSDLTESHDHQGYVERFNALTDAERRALGDNFIMIADNAAEHDAQRAACELFTCTPCPDDGCEARVAATIVLGFLAGGLAGRLIDKVLLRWAASARPASAASTAHAGGELRPVGAVLESIDDVYANPQLLSGQHPVMVETILRGTPGWRIETLGRGSHAGQGWVFRQYTGAGNPTGLQLRWHPGGGRHGPAPYWRVVGPNGDLGGIIR